MKKIRKSNPKNKTQKQAGAATKPAWMPASVPPGGVRVGCGAVLIGDIEGNPTQLIFSPVLYRLLSLVVRLSSRDDTGELFSRVSLRWLCSQADLYDAKQTHRSKPAISEEHLRRLFRVLDALGLVLSRREWGGWSRRPQIDAIRRFACRVLPVHLRGHSEGIGNRKERRKRAATGSRRRRRSAAIGRESGRPPVPVEVSPERGTWRKFDAVGDEVRAAAIELIAVLRAQDEALRSAEQDPDRGAIKRYWDSVHPVLRAREREIEARLHALGVLAHRIPYFLGSCERHSELLIGAEPP